MCRTGESRCLERFIVGLIHDLDVGVVVQLHQTCSL
jgi:hypothetical protein